MDCKTRWQKYRCCVCHGFPGSVFMIKDSLWDSVVRKNPNLRIICWDCFEQLLGREIKADDLKPNAPCNKIFIRLLRQIEALNERSHIS